ncbi:hypothetical protein VVD49_21275 [Uliginosibacterium sp. H3]|uniref:Uncharacterized protein n=1 Tax=Uliginosibacterium silvisoli TaxID=3114758 RepID=A0ABU6K8R7_9RHOO|nr:hypothetical protein [Uliginosibacterium sp. H3]
MELREIDELRAAMPVGRTVYHYYKDRYSLQLLRYAVPRETPVSVLRNGAVAGLLQKPRVQPVLAACNGVLSPILLKSADGDVAEEHYTLSIGAWGRNEDEQKQMSRRGANLVLQLNFSRRHDEAFNRVLKPDVGIDPFNYSGHPAVHSEEAGRRYTLAWARLDIDLDRGEAVIEEIQSDWVREAAYARDMAKRYEPGLRRYYKLDADAGKIASYCEEVLAPHAAVWDETMLSAALFFLREELSIKHIYYHTPETGVRFKDIKWTAPPRSLYTNLPRRFCFRETEELPGFLAANKRIANIRRCSPKLRLQKLLV